MPWVTEEGDRVKKVSVVGEASRRGEGAKDAFRGWDFVMQAHALGPRGTLISSLAPPLGGVGHTSLLRKYLERNLGATI